MPSKKTAGAEPAVWKTLAVKVGAATAIYAAAVLALALAVLL